MALSISFTAFLANVLGYVTLANLLGNGLLKSSYLALILYAFVVVLDELVQMALISQPASAAAASSDTPRPTAAGCRFMGVGSTATVFAA